MSTNVVAGPALSELSLGLRLTANGVWWVVVMDGRRARLLVREHRRASFLESVDALTIDADGEAIRPHETGHHHGRYEQTERKFVERIARNLERRAKQDAFDHLIVVAPPAALGVLREALGPHTRDRLRESVPKDLSGLPARHIVERLQAGDL